jgi:hypothetical protein
LPNFAAIGAIDSIIQALKSACRSNKKTAATFWQRRFLKTQGGAGF